MKECEKWYYVFEELPKIKGEHKFDVSGVRG